MVLAQRTEESGLCKNTNTQNQMCLRC